MPAVLANISNTASHSRCPPGRPSALTRTKNTLKICNWSDEQLEAAIHAHDAGMSMRQAALKYNIPYNTFQEHLFGDRLSRDHGAKRVLNHEEEKKLAGRLVQMAKTGRGLSPTTLSWADVHHSKMASRVVVG